MVLDSAVDDQWVSRGGNHACKEIGDNYFCEVWMFDRRVY